MKKSYTVKDLSELSNVSVRTLHHYDKIDLLKPAYLGENGYRYYEKQQLLLLQQILFYRQLGFKLRKIKYLLGKSDFDIKLALTTHRAALAKDIEKTQRLIETIDKTLLHLTAEEKMNDHEFYQGFPEDAHAKIKDEIG